MLSESLDSKIHLENKFYHKMSLNICYVILTHEIHVKFFGVKISEKPPKKGFRWYDYFLYAISNKITRANKVNPLPD